MSRIPAPAGKRRPGTKVLDGGRRGLYSGKTKHSGIMSLAKLYEAHRTGQGDDRLVKIVVVSRRIIWLWAPKNAGGSVSRALMNVHGADAVVCDLALEALWTLNPDMRSFRVMAIKRNPYTRAVSCWLNKIMFQTESNEGYFKRFAGLRQGMSFPEFAAWLNSPEGGDRKANPHWQSQYLQLGRADELLSFEDLPESARALGIEPSELPHKNRHTEMTKAAAMESRPLVDWYDAAAYRDITERYARDLEFLGYGFPGDPPTDAPESALAPAHPGP